MHNPSIYQVILVVLLILIGSLLIIVKLAESSFSRSRTLSAYNKEYGPFGFYGGIAMILLAFFIIIKPALQKSDRWHDDEKEQMVEKVMESSQILKSMDADTARLVAECFIEAYTKKYKPSEMRKQNTLSEEEIAAITDPIMNICLRKYGYLQNQHPDSVSVHNP